MFFKFNFFQIQNNGLKRQFINGNTELVNKHEIS